MSSKMNENLEENESKIGCKKYYKNKEYHKQYYIQNKEKFVKKITLARRHYPMEDSDIELYGEENLLLVAHTKKALAKFRTKFPEKDMMELLFSSL